jgi:hypothetical protein
MAEAERRQHATEVKQEVEREVELRLLAALCAPALDDQTRDAILHGLAKHKFASSDHEMIFRALVNMPTASAGHIRETLGARLTRLGFPDIDVEPIFEAESPSAEKITALLRQLKR